MSHNKHFNFKKLSEDQLEKYRNDGYLSVGQVLTDEGLQLMREQCMSAWNDAKEGFDPEQSWLKNSLLTNIHHHGSLVRDYYFDGPLVDIATDVIGPNIKGVTTQLTFKMRGNTMGFGWHQDNGYGELDPYNAITCLTALDDTDQDNGCLWIIPGSHKQEQIPVEHSLDDKSQQKSIDLQVDETDAIPISMKAGESIFFHCWTLHKSDGNLSKTRDRRILFMRYADADAVEVYNDRQPRLGRLLRGETRFDEVGSFEKDL